MDSRSIQVFFDDALHLWRYSKTRSLVASLNPGDVRRQLKSKFKFEESETDHHIYTLVVEDKVVRWTKVSHGNKEIYDTLIGKMAQQLGVRNKQFSEMINCSISKDQYYSLIN